MQSVTITTTRGQSDCDDCGFFDWANATIELSGGTSLFACYDGHLGGGNWSGSLDTLLQWALEALGYVVQVNGESVGNFPFYERNAHSEWELLPLLPEQHEVLNIRTQTEADPEWPGQRHIVRIEMPRFEGKPGRVIDTRLTEDGSRTWDGEWTGLFKELLEQRTGSLTVVQHHDEYDEEDLDVDKDVDALPPVDADQRSA